MEATKSTRKTNKRKPLTDLTNTNPSSHLSSSTIKPQTKSSLKEKGKGPIDKENPSSILSPPPKTPVSGIGDSLVFEASTVYKRRHTTADKMKSKLKGVVEPLSCSLETRMPDLRNKRYGDGDIGLSKSCPMPSKKKQHREKAEVNASKHDLPQDFIDKQRAYFAEIDAFELEEEVASDDELEERKKRKQKHN